MAGSLIDHFSQLDDPRIDRHKQHELVDIIVLCVCAVIGGAEGWEAMEEFGKAKLSWLRQYVPLANGIPAHDTIARVISRLSSKGLQECFLNWIQSVTEMTDGEIVAIDGKTLRRSYDRSSREQPSIWSVPGQTPMVWFLDRSRLQRSPMKSLPSRSS